MGKGCSSSVKRMSDFKTRLALKRGFPYLILVPHLMLEEVRGRDREIIDGMESLETVLMGGEAKGRSTVGLHM